MPEECTWGSFFDPESILRKLGLAPTCEDVIDFGCGDGTFSIPAAKIVSGTVHALDIDLEMIATTKAKAEAAGLGNVRTCLRDFVADGSGLPGGSVDYAMLFNILHGESPRTLLREAFRVLSPCGKLGIIHWNYDPTTPRGPPMDIRPRPEQCRDWAVGVGFRLLEPGLIGLPPYHSGVVLEKPNVRAGIS
jgi:SAM-dependent methyltransferase